MVLPLLFNLPPTDAIVDSPDVADMAQYAPPTTSDGEVMTTHANALREHRNEVPARRDWSRQLPQRSKATSIVYGYLPYWITSTSKIQWDLLSHVAFFSLEASADGSISNKHGWPDTKLVETAHLAGVKVDVAFTLFSGSGLSTLLNSSTNRAKLIKNMIAEMEAGGADGISLDFEGVPKDARDGLTAFCTELRTALNAKGHPKAQISIAAPAVDWSGAFNIPELLKQIDIYFIMSYDFFYKGSTKAGPSGIFRTSTKWQSASTQSTLRTLATTSKLATESLRKKVVVGVPFYGYAYGTPGTEWPASVTSAGVTMTYAQARAKLASGTPRTWDKTICQPALMWEENSSWHQSWYEDDASLECKFQLVEEHDIGGTGMWSLGMDTGYDELWALLSKHFTADVKLGEGSRDAPIAVTKFPYEDARDTSKEGYRYFDYYSCKSDVAEYGRELVYQIDVCQKGALHLEVAGASSADPDLHLLSALREDKCIERNDTQIDKTIEPGRYYVVVDTFVKNSIELEGAYTLKATFTPSAGGACPSGSTCQSGKCTCPSNQELCENVCVIVATNNEHCGGCGKVCGAGTTCQSGQCKSGNPSDAGESDSSATDAARDTSTSEDTGALIEDDATTADVSGSTDGSSQGATPIGGDSGCSCKVGEGQSGAPTMSWISLLLGGLLVGRRRRAKGSTDWRRRS